MQTIRKISSLKPKANIGFFDHLEVYTQPLAFKRSNFSKALSSKEKCSTPAKNVDEQNRLRSGKMIDHLHNVGLEESEKNANSPVSPSIGNPGNFRPRHVTVLHIPPNTQTENNIENIGKKSELTKKATLLSANGITDEGLVGDVNNAKISAIKFDRVKSKRLMLLPLVIYENAQVATAVSDNDNNDKETLPTVECEYSGDNQSDGDGNEVFSFQLPHELSPNLEKTPISSMKVDFQMMLPNVQKIMEDYIDLMRNTHRCDNNFDKSNLKSKKQLTFNFNGENAENSNNPDKCTPNGTIPLDFKAEISGCLGLSMDQLDEKKLQEVKDVDFKNLITAITGNLASIAIQKSYEHMEQRNFCTSSGNSNLSKTYTANFKKSCDVQKAEMSNDNNKNNLIEEENLPGKSLTTVPRTPISKSSDSHTTITSTVNVTEKTDLVENTRDLTSIEEGKLENSIISSKLESEIVIFSEGYVYSEGVHKPKDYAPIGSQIYDHAIKPTSTNTVGESESLMIQNPKELEHQAEEFKLPSSELSTIMQISSPFPSEGNKCSKDAESSIDCNENKGKDSDAKNKEPYSDCLATTDVGCTVLFKKNYFPLQIEEIRKGFKNYAMDCTMLSSFYQASKLGKQIDCSAINSGSKKKDEKPKADISSCVTKEKGSKSDSCGQSKETKSNPCSTSHTSFGKIDPCSPFTSRRDSACALFKKKENSSCGKKDQNQEFKFDCSTLRKQTAASQGDKKSSSKIDCSSICGKDSAKKDDKKSESKIDCSSLGEKKAAPTDAKKSSSKTDCSAICGTKADSGKKGDKKPESKIDCSSSSGTKTAPTDKKSGTKIDCSAISGKKDEKKSGSDICGKKTDSGQKDKKKLESRIQCSSVGEKKLDSKIDCSAICGKKDEKKSEPKIDCSALGGKKSDSSPQKKSDTKIDCSAVCGKKSGSPGGKKSESKIDCSALSGKKDENKAKVKTECSPFGGKKSDSSPQKKSNTKIDCSAVCGKKSGSPGGKKSESKIDCSAMSGKKDEKKSKPKIDCSSLGGKKSDNPCGKKPESKIACSELGGKKSESKIDCSAICGKKDEKKSKPKIDCSSLGGRKSQPKIDCSAILGKKDESKSKSKIDCSALGGKKSDSSLKKKSESKIDCSAVRRKKSDSPRGKKSESKIDCSAICGKKDESKSKSKIDCSALGGKKSDNPCGKKSESKIDCSAICGKKDEKKSKPKIDCSSLGGRKSQPKIDCSAILGKKDESKSKSKIDCSALGGKKSDSSAGKKSESKIDCSAVCGKKSGSPVGKKSESKIDCSAFGGKKSDNPCGKKSESKIDCSAICGKKDEKKSKPKIDCSSLGGRKSQPKIDCSAILGKKDDSKSKPKIDCSALGGKKLDSSAGKKSESKIDCSAVCGKKSGSPGGKKSESKIDCSAMSGKKDEKKSKPKIDCSSLGVKKSDNPCGKKSESKIDCSSICGKKDGKETKPKIDCSSLGGKKSDNPCGKKPESKISCSELGGKKSESKIDCSSICGKKDGKETKPKIDCSSLGGRKSQPKIDCSAILGKKDDSKSKPKIDCSTLGGKKSDSSSGKKSESKIDCSAICGKKSGSPGGKKSESKIDCSAISGKKDEKKSKPKIDCSSLGGKKSDNPCGKKPESKISCSELGGKKSESKIDCSSICGKKDGKETKPKIDCSSLGGRKSQPKIDCAAIFGKKEGKGKKPDNPCGKKPESKIDCSALGGKKSDSPCGSKSESKIDCSSTCGKNDDMKSDETKSSCQCGMKDCQCGKKDNPCAVQTIKIFLTQGMHIEITTAQINKENVQIVQDLLSSKLKSQTNTEKAGKSGALNCITLNPEEEGGEVTIGPISIFFDDPKKLLPGRADKKLRGDKRNQNISPFIGGDAKSFSTDSRKSHEHYTRPVKKKFKITPPVMTRGKSDTEHLKQPDCITYLNPGENIYLQDERLNSESEKTLINKIVRILDCREVCLESIPVAPIGDYDVLLKVDTVALSGSDLYMYETGAKTENVVSLGHEASGVVEKIGKHVTNLNVGDRVAVEPGVPCGTCDNCKRGRYNICRDTIFNGSLAKYCVHPADFCHKLPDNCNLEDGALIHQLALGLYACNRANVSVKSNVLIIGACPLGLCCILCAKAMGARHIAIVDTLQKNIEVAQKLGADMPILLNERMTNKDVIKGILSNMTCIGHPNVAINCSGCTNSLNTAVKCLAPGGVCVLAGCQTESGHFNILDALMKEINMVSSFRSCNTFPHAISLLDNCKAELYHLITHRYFMSQIKNAFETGLDEQNSQAVKVVIKCQEECQEEMPEGSNVKRF